MHKALMKINLLRKPTKSQLFFKISVVTTGSAFCPKLYKTREISRSPAWSAWGLFLESPGNFSCPKSCFMFAVFPLKIEVSKILKMIQWNGYQFNEVKSTSLWASNCATIQKVLILKIAFGPEKLPGLSKNRPQVPGAIPGTRLHHLIDSIPQFLASKGTFSLVFRGLFLPPEEYQGKEQGYPTRI